MPSDNALPHPGRRAQSRPAAQWLPQRTLCNACRGRQPRRRWGRLRHSRAPSPSPTCAVSSKRRESLDCPLASSESVHIAPVETSFAVRLFLAAVDHSAALAAGKVHPYRCLQAHKTNASADTTSSLSTSLIGSGSILFSVREQCHEPIEAHA